MKLQSLRASTLNELNGSIARHWVFGEPQNDLFIVQLHAERALEKSLGLFQILLHALVLTFQEPVSVF